MFGHLQFKIKSQDFNRDDSKSICHYRLLHLIIIIIIIVIIIIIITINIIIIIFIIYIIIAHVWVNCKTKYYAFCLILCNVGKLRPSVGCLYVVKTAAPKMVLGTYSFLKNLPSSKVNIEFCLKGNKNRGHCAGFGDKAMKDNTFLEALVIFKDGAY